LRIKQSQKDLSGNQETQETREKKNFLDSCPSWLPYIFPGLLLYYFSEMVLEDLIWTLAFFGGIDYHMFVAETVLVSFG